MRKFYVTFSLSLFCLLPLSAQLVTKKDYDLGVSAHAGIHSGLSIPDTKGLSLSPSYGIGVTVPFDRVWFLEAELLYSATKYKQEYEKQPLSIRSDQIALPLYLKYTLPSNSNRLLFGGYAAYHFNKKIPNDFRLPEKAIHSWEGGIMLGFEQSLHRHLYISLKALGGFRKVIDNKYMDKKYFPVQFRLTLGYSLFRLNDCGCH